MTKRVRRPDEPAPLVALRVAGRAVGTVDRTSRRARTVIAKAQFPLRAPSVPGGVAVLPAKRRTGADFDTDWARRPLAVAVRRVLVAGPVRGAVKLVASPEIVGLDRLTDLRKVDEGEDPATVIFVANHHSHVDAPLVLSSVPSPWQSRLVVGAAADYFFATRVTGAASALALGAIPIDRSRVNRRSADLATDLLNDGWSLVIFPEGGRSPDGWGQPFRGGAAFLAVRTGAPVVPMHLEGTGAIWGKGTNRLRPGRTRVTFGSPIWPGPDADARELADRIELAVARLADESLTDWWSAARRAARGQTPPLTGPDAGGWRRAWALAERRARGKEGERARLRDARTWPAR